MNKLFVCDTQKWYKRKMMKYLIPWIHQGKNWSKYSNNNSNNIAADVRKVPMICQETMGHTNKLRGSGS